MKKLISAIFLVVLSALLFAGCDQSVGAPAGTDPTETTGSGTEAVTKAPETEVLATGPVDPDGEFEIVLGDPVLVYQAEEGVQGWGKHQFPGIGYIANNTISVNWSYGEDKVGATGNKTYRKVTMNGGKTWFWAENDLNGILAKYPMKNGKYFTRVAGEETVRGVDLTGYEPVLTWEKNGTARALYFAEDLLDCASAVEKGVFQMEVILYDKETDKTESKMATLNWPYAPVALYHGEVIYTLSGWFQQSGKNFVATDDALYTCIYALGFDSTASSREEAILDNYWKYSVYVFSSEDCGLTWNFLSQISPDDVPSSDEADGCGEPKMIQMEDGSFFMLIRTGSNSPMYWTRSTDNCRTWSEPQQFDEFGVLPQLLTLDCGVTLASYGRPKLMVRGTSDPSGVTWQDPVQVPLTRDGYKNPDGISCFYTGMVALDENTALMVYTDFVYPNKDGVGARAVLVRKIHVVPKGE